MLIVRKHPRKVKYTKQQKKATKITIKTLIVMKANIISYEITDNFNGQNNICDNCF